MNINNEPLLEPVQNKLITSMKATDNLLFNSTL